MFCFYNFNIWLSFKTLRGGRCITRCSSPGFSLIQPSLHCCLSNEWNLALTSLVVFTFLWQLTWAIRVIVNISRPLFTPLASITITRNYLSFLHWGTNRTFPNKTQLDSTTLWSLWSWLLWYNCVRKLCCFPPSQGRRFLCSCLYSQINI